MSEKKPNTIIGRPTKYTEELAEYICHILETNPHGIKRLVKMYPALPDDTTIAIWRAKYESFSRRYKEARLKQTDLLYENAIDQVEELEDYKYKNERTGAICIDPGIVAMKKAIANQKVRHAAQLNPKEYDTRRGEESLGPQETLNKIQSLVSELNKTNVSEI